MYEYRKAETRSGKNVCHWKATSMMRVFLYYCLIFPACKSHLSWTELCRHMWPVWLYHIFQSYVLKGKILGGKFVEQNVCLVLSTALSETFLILRRTERDIMRNAHRYSCKVPVILVRF
jgi:hypothetical protein